MSDKKKSVLVTFGTDLPKKSNKWWQQFKVVVAYKELKPKVQERGLIFADLGDFIELGSIYEASALVEELSR